MSFRDAVVLELRVAGSRNSQPVWFRILKWTVIVSGVAYFWGAPHFWWWIAGLAGLGVGVHLLWRTKTKRWTQPWFGWNDLAATRPVAKNDEPR